MQLQQRILYFSVAININNRYHFDEPGIIDLLVLKLLLQLLHLMNNLLHGLRIIGLLDRFESLKVITHEAG